MQFSTSLCYSLPKQLYKKKPGGPKEGAEAKRRPPLSVLQTTVARISSVSWQLDPETQRWTSQSAGLGREPDSSYLYGVWPASRFNSACQLLANHGGKKSRCSQKVDIEGFCLGRIPRTGLDFGSVPTPSMVTLSVLLVEISEPGRHTSQFSNLSTDKLPRYFGLFLSQIWKILGYLTQHHLDVRSI